MRLKVRSNLYDYWSKRIAKETMVEALALSLNIVHSIIVAILVVPYYDHSNAPKNLKEEEVVGIINDCYSEYTDIVKPIPLFIKWKKLDENILGSCDGNIIYLNNIAEFQSGFSKKEIVPIQHVIIHEMGHAFGLKHNYQSLVMYPRHIKMYDHPLYLSVSDISNLMKVKDGK